MRKNSLRNRTTRLFLATAVAGSAFQLSGCDPAVRDTLTAGLQQTTQSLASALISAFFLSISDGASGGLTTT